MRPGLARLLLATLLFGAHADAAAPSWSIARSQHFEVYATGSPERATDALQMFENVHAFFSSYLSLPPTPRRLLKVIVFSGDKEYAPYKVNEGADAFYQPSRGRDYIVMKNFGRDAARIVAHEYAHAALGPEGADLPPWLSEGLAEFFSSVALDGGNARLGLVPDGRLNPLRRGDLMPVADLVEVRRDSATYNNRDHAGLFYAESWALTHMLMVDKRYREGAPRLLSTALQGMKPAYLFSQLYGKTPIEVDKDLRAYIRREAFGTSTARFPPAARSAASPEPVPAFEASVLLAGLLASQLGRDEETRATLVELLTEQPDHLPLLEMRAFFELRTLGGAAAQLAFQRAIDHGSRNPLILAQHGLLIAPNDPAGAADFLQRAAALTPENAEIRIRAAAAQLVVCKPAEAMSMLAAVVRIPSNLLFTYYQVAATANAALGKTEAATAAAAQLTAAARTPEEKQTASLVAARVRAETGFPAASVTAAPCGTQKPPFVQ